MLGDLQFNAKPSRRKACLSDDNVRFFNHFSIPQIAKASSLIEWFVCQLRVAIHQSVFYFVGVRGAQGSCEIMNKT